MRLDITLLKAAAVTAYLVAPGVARAQALSTDPQGSSVIVNAVHWIEGTFLGSLATTIAVIAVAWTGLAMLSGRMNVRRGLTVILGCFLLFGARDIVGGLRESSFGSVAGSDVPRQLPDRPQAPRIPVNADPFDPYAGQAAR